MQYPNNRSSQRSNRKKKQSNLTQFLRAQEEKFPDKRDSSPTKSPHSLSPACAVLGARKVVAVDKRKHGQTFNKWDSAEGNGRG